MSDQQISPARAKDSLRYASVLVTMGVDPDRPDHVAAEMIVDPSKRTICGLQQARILRGMAAKLEADHAAGIC